jgi:hypothetical protein
MTFCLQKTDTATTVAGTGCYLYCRTTAHVPSTVCYWRNAKKDGEPVGYHRDVRYIFRVNLPTKWIVSILVIS